MVSQNKFCTIDWLRWEAVAKIFKWHPNHCWTVTHIVSMIITDFFLFNRSKTWMRYFCYCFVIASFDICAWGLLLWIFSVCWHQFNMVKQNKNIQIARSSNMKLALVSKGVTDTYPPWKEKVIFPRRSFQVHCEISSCWLVVSGQNLHKVLFIFSEKKIGNWYDRENSVINCYNFAFYTYIFGQRTLHCLLNLPF